MTIRKSLRFSTVLGDLQGKTGQTEVLVFTDDESVELNYGLIQKNYAQNANKLGFNLYDLWDSPRDASILADHAEAIQRELGALYYGPSELIEAHPSLAVRDIEELPSGVSFGFGTFELEDDWAGKIYIDDYLSLVLFIILQGIPGVGWQQLEPAPLLFGGDYALVDPGNPVGYGLTF